MGLLGTGARRGGCVAAVDRRVRDLAGCDVNKDAPVCAAVRVPQAMIYAIDVSFAALHDKAEFEYLNQQPTSFVLPPEALDRLRAAAGTIFAASPECRRMLKDSGVKLVDAAADGPTAPAPSTPPKATGR